MTTDWIGSYPIEREIGRGGMGVVDGDHMPRVYLKTCFNEIHGRVSRDGR